MYVIFDFKNSICQMGLGKLTHAGLQAGLFTPASAIQIFEAKPSFWSALEFKDGWVVQICTQNPTTQDPYMSANDVNAANVAHNAHFRMPLRGSAALQKLFVWGKKAFAAWEHLLEFGTGTAPAARLFLRSFCGIFVTWNFFAMGSSGAATVKEQTLDEAQHLTKPFEVADFLEAVGRTPLAEKISLEKRVFSTGEIPKLQGMSQYRYLPLTSAKTEDDDDVKILLFAPVESFLSLQRGNTKVQRERAVLVCNGLGLFVLSKKNLLLVAEKDLTTPQAVPHYALYALDPQTAKVFSNVKSCKEIPVNLKEAFSYL